MSGVISRLDGLCLRGLVRCLSTRSRGPIHPEFINLNRVDIDALRLWWALSQSVGKLTDRVRTRPREIAGVLGIEDRQVIGEIPGVLNASETAYAQLRAGDPSIFVVSEASPTWLSGPNRVLAITLLEAERAIAAAIKNMRQGLFLTAVLERSRTIEEALRVSSLREILMVPAGRSRLTAYERKQARKARTPLYRLACESDEALQAIDALDSEALARMFAEGMLPALEIWRRFELVCLLECVSALSDVTGEAAVLDVTFSAVRPLATIGDISVWWQRTIPSRPDNVLDPGEATAMAMAQSLNASTAAGRADATVERDGIVLAFIECKWFESSSSAPSTIVDACIQLTKYARDYNHHHPHIDATQLLSKSLIALANRNNAPLVLGYGQVCCADLEDIDANALNAWASYVVGNTTT